MVEHYKFVGEDGVDSDVPLGCIVRFELGLRLGEDRSTGLWRDPDSDHLKGQSFEHSSLIPYRAKFKTFDLVTLKEGSQTSKKLSIACFFCNLQTGEWIYTLNGGRQYSESELIGVPKTPMDQPNVVEKRDDEAKCAAYAAHYGGGFSTASASAMRAYHAAQVYGNWGPIRDPFRAVQAGQPIQAGDAVSVNGVTGRAVPANQMVGRVVRMPAYYPDSGFNTNSYSHLILWRPE